MAYDKLQLLYEGKTKRFWLTNNPKQAIAEFRDDPTMYHSKKKEYFTGKGALCNQINAILMQVLQENNIPTHFLEQIDQNCTLVKRAEMIPVEVVVHNYTAGSMCRRLGLEAHKKLKFPVMEFCYKNDELNDPVINEYHAYAMGLCTQEEMTIMTYNAMRVNKVLCDLFDSIGMVVADFKLEFGRVGNFLVVADEITPNVGRFWDKDSMSRIKYTLGSAEKEYEIILERLKQAAKDLL
ncbi:MAG: phosphoribosylaminoimidazolesuccinocarboxamide synthase [Clostridia bacterium]|nr:phosphoribosylaminoimidazolesuccinocarboxamide synthase [Clostridia bacterium]MBQ8772665.1 phosphoribosylaminoimidazolesuccinocarboxamide synthase [Clostridia bacterium]MBQ8872430.1 phosphoribosylaminoimidazolesuccinocarboxamide synthase [Clostridia bacterium]